MKLKYFMGGLGLGIILTTVILSIDAPKAKLSDTEIMQRASELGMITEEQNNQVLDQVLHNNKPTGTNEQPSVTPTVTPEIVPTTVPSESPTMTPEPTKEPEQQLITFTIDPGMSTNKVALLLAQVGLITDVEDFKNYIVKNGKTFVLQVGTYSLPAGSSYEDIKKTITK